MGPKEATEYRKIVARLNYLALDRPNMTFACKEAPRVMAEPDWQDRERLERIAGLLKAYPRLVYKYDLQGAGSLGAATDADWAGCITSRRSTGGGCDDT